MNGMLHCMDSGVRAIRAVLGGVAGRFISESIMRAGEVVPAPRVATLSTGYLGIDRVLGGGGLPRGRIIEIVGPQSSGKTTLALHVIAQVQRQGGTCAFIDAEHALEAGYAVRLGIRGEQLWVSKPQDAEQAMAICLRLAESGGLDAIVVDSVAALATQAELAAQLGTAADGSRGRFFGQAMATLMGALHQAGCVLICIDQQRGDAGGRAEGGEAVRGVTGLEFHSSVRIIMHPIGPVVGEGGLCGERVRIWVAKTPLALGTGAVDVDLLHGRGIWAAADLVDTGLEAGVLRRAGRQIRWQDSLLGRSREGACRGLDADPAMAGRLRAAVLARLELLSQGLPETSFS